MLDILAAGAERLKPFFTVLKSTETRLIGQRHWIINDGSEVAQKFIVECWSKNWIVDDVEVINKLI